MKTPDVPVKRHIADACAKNWPYRCPMRRSRDHIGHAGVVFGFQGAPPLVEQRPKVGRGELGCDNGKVPTALVGAAVFCLGGAKCPGGGRHSHWSPDRQRHLGAQAARRGDVADVRDSHFRHQHERAAAGGLAAHIRDEPRQDGRSCPVRRGHGTGTPGHGPHGRRQVDGVQLGEQ